MMKASEYQKKYNPQYDFIIGIDPGLSNGVVEFDRIRNVYCFNETYDFWETIDHIEVAKGYQTLILIENPNLSKPTFYRGILAPLIQDTISQRVGSNKRTAQLIIEYCKMNNITYKEIKPTTKKWTAKEFQSKTGVKSRCSQHVRDAGRLVHEYLNGKK